MFCCVSMKEYCGIIIGVNIEYNTFCFARETCSRLPNYVSSTGFSDFQFCPEMNPIL